MIAEDRVIRVLPADTPGLVRTVEHEIDDRWLRAFAASVGDTRPEFFDLEHTGGIVGHPVFPVCIEWPLVEHGAPGIELTDNTLRLGLHVSHQMRLHAPLRPEQRVRTEAELHLAEARTDATLIATRFRTYSSDGELLVTTLLHMLYRGVRLEGSKTPDHPHEVTRQSRTGLSPLAKFTVDATNAVIYTECARIWNPIHTDIRVAHAAGLPDTVLHGTETLARTISAISRAGTLPIGALVTGIGCRFTGPVFPGATLTVSTATLSEDSVAFDVQDTDGTSSISDGTITFELPS